jgi:hypothetical protein
MGCPLTIANFEVCLLYYLLSLLLYLLNYLDNVYNHVHAHFRRVRRLRVDRVGHVSHRLLQARPVTPCLPEQDDPGPRVQRYR